MEVTACAMASRVVVRGGAAFGGQDLGERGGARDHCGSAACQGFQSGQAERLVRAGRECDIGGRQDGGDGVAAPDVTGEVDGQARRLAFEPGAHRTFADDDQPGINARVSQGGNGIDTAVRVLLHRQPAAMHQQRLFRARPLLPNRGGPPAGMELVEVDPERHRDHVRGVDPVELFPCERRRAHHGVVALGGAPVGGVGDRTSRARPEVSARQGDQAVRERSSRLRRRGVCPTRPSERRVSRSDTSRASGASWVSRSVTGPGSTAR